MATTEQIAKLPKWAQDEIFQLAQERDRWKALATAGPEDSNTSIQQLAGGRPTRVPLGRNVRIVFTLDDGSDVTVHNEGGHLDVNLNGVGVYTSLGVFPRQSNVVLLSAYDHNGAM